MAFTPATGGLLEHRPKYLVESLQYERLLVVSCLTAAASQPEAACTGATPVEVSPSTRVQQTGCEFTKHEKRPWFPVSRSGEASNGQRCAHVPWARWRCPWPGWRGAGWCFSARRSRRRRRLVAVGGHALSVVQQRREERVAAGRVDGRQSGRQAEGRDSL